MYRKIICPIDGSEPSEHGMKEAIQLAKDQNARLAFLHVVDLSPLIVYGPILADFDGFREAGQKLLATAVAAAQVQGVSAEVRMNEIMAGRPGEMIADEAKKYGADLIVMGTHGRRGFSRALLGSDAAAVIGSSDVPLLLVK
jgi:nucleotide-binding universal stress UspA family protein